MLLLICFRPSGQCFSNPAYEKQKNDILEKSRRLLVDIGLKEKHDEIKMTEKELEVMEEKAQQLSFSSYKKLYAKLKKVEDAQSKSLTENINRKIQHYFTKEKILQDLEPLNLPRVKRKKHRNTQREVKRRYNKRKRLKKSEKKKMNTKIEIANIKKSNLVKNFSDEEVPDEAYLYLSLGSTFCPTVRKEKHDYVFDTKEFCRKLEWKALFQSMKQDQNDTKSEEDEDLFQESNGEDGICGWTRSEKLKIKSRKYPQYSNNLLSHVTKNIKDRVNEITMPKFRVL